MPSKLTTLITLTVFMYAAGYWLHRSGSPYGTLPLTVHKLLALGAMGLAGTMIFTAYKGVGLQGFDLFLWAGTALLLLVLIGTGGALSAMEKAPDWVRTVHRVLPYLATALAGFSVAEALERIQ